MHLPYSMPHFIGHCSILIIYAGLFHSGCKKRRGYPPPLILFRQLAEARQNVFNDYFRLLAFNIMASDEMDYLFSIHHCH